MQTKRKNARTKGKKGIDHKCTTITVNRLHTMPFFLTRLHWRIHDIIFKTSISTKEDGIKKILKIQNKKEKNRIKIFFFGGGGVTRAVTLFSPFLCSSHRMHRSKFYTGHSNQKSEKKNHTTQVLHLNRRTPYNQPSGFSRF